jgi:hypothetical protein
MAIFDVYLDTEWASNNDLLTAQVVCDNQIYFYYNNGFPHLTKKIEEYNFFEYFKGVQYNKPIFVPFDCSNLFSYEDLFSSSTLVPLKGFIYKDFFSRHFGAKDAIRVLKNHSEKQNNEQINKINKQEKQEKQEKITLNLSFFYSMRDVTYFLGDDILKYCCRNFPKKNNVDYIIQKNKIDGRITRESKTILETFSNQVTIVLKDKFGWTAGSRKFTDLCGMLAIPDRFKGNCDKYKSCMEMYLSEGFDTTGFINYSINDVLQLVDVDSKMPEMLNKIYSKMNLGPGKLFSKENIPGSIGSIVSCFLERLANNHFSKSSNQESFQAENKRWEVEKDYSTTIRNKRNNLQNKITRSTKTNPTDVPAVPKDKEKGKEKEKRRPKGDYISSLLSAGGVRSLFYLNRNNSAVLNSVVQGGRTYNEQYDKYKSENCFDIDFTGCYGKALSQFILPVGIPYVWGLTSGQAPMTVREYYAQNEHELVDNLYTITISGTLPFSQNLLYSKITDATKIATKMEEILSNSQFEIEEDVSGEFVPFGNELKNTIITSDLKKAIDNICTHSEKKAFYDCYVESACVYKKSDEKSQGDFIKTLQEADPSECYKYDPEIQGVTDKRPRCWTGIPLKDLIEPLLKLRKELKNLVKQKVEPFLNGCLQNVVKLITNTTYGVLASTFFEFGNTVVANNITARARLNVWLMSRTLMGFQSITDGCQYQPQEVLTIKKINPENKDQKIKLPGLETLSDLRKLKEHRFIKTVSLGGEDWPAYISNIKKVTDFNARIDVLAHEHLKTFWDHYGLQIQYDVEHKPDHIAKILFTIKSSHYSEITPYD